LAVSSSRLNFDVVTCVNRKNIRELDTLYEYLVEKGVKAWRLFTIVPIGRAREHPDLHLSDHEFKEMLDFIAGKRVMSSMDVKFSCEGYVGAYELKVRDTPFFCRAGIQVGSVLIDGSISACPNIDHAFAQGNIFQDNFFEIWETRFEPFRDRSWTRTGRCATCSDYRYCQGNGFHNWHGDQSSPLVCHKEKLDRALSALSMV
jgi:radical SAM protein with 4Fe4S-binding SPASM domain